MKLKLVSLVTLGTAFAAFAGTATVPATSTPTIEAHKVADASAAKVATPADTHKAPAHHAVKHHTSESDLNEWWMVDGKVVDTQEMAIKELEANLEVVEMITKNEAFKLDAAKQTLITQELDSARKALLDLKELSLKPDSHKKEVWSPRFEDGKKSLNVAITTLPDEYKTKAREHKKAHRAKKHHEAAKPVVVATPATPAATAEAVKPAEKK